MISQKGQFVWAMYIIGVGAALVVVIAVGAIVFLAY
jgi:hypothetical protein